MRTTPLVFVWIGAGREAVHVQLKISDRKRVRNMTQAQSPDGGVGCMELLSVIFIRDRIHRKRGRYRRGKGGYLGTEAVLGNAKGMNVTTVKCKMGNRLGVQTMFAAGNVARGVGSCGTTTRLTYCTGAYQTIAPESAQVQGMTDHAQVLSRDRWSGRDTIRDASDSSEAI